MLVRKCDRCGKLEYNNTVLGKGMERGNPLTGVVPVRRDPRIPDRPPLMDEDFDLCDDCLIDFYNFMEAKPRKENAPAEITDALINCLENLFGFDFHIWQKEYLKTGNSDFLRPAGRGTGKTFIYLLRLLLIEGGAKMDLEDFSDIKKYLAEPTYGNVYYPIFFDEIRKINDKLVNAGFKTNAKLKGEK